MMASFGRADPEVRRQVEKLIRACGPHVRDYFDMRNKDDYWANGEVWVAWPSFRVGSEALLPAKDPAAFAVVHALKREPVLSLYDIGVSPEWRGMGLATGLMQAACLANPQATRIRLVVSQGNDAAIRLYESWGLKPGEPRATRRNGMVVPFDGEPRWR